MFNVQFGQIVFDDSDPLTFTKASLARDWNLKTRAALKPCTHAPAPPLPLQSY